MGGVSRGIVATCAAWTPLLRRDTNVSILEEVRRRIYGAGWRMLEIRGLIRSIQLSEHNGILRSTAVKV